VVTECKFQPQLFNRCKCSVCFKPKDLHQNFAPETPTPRGASVSVYQPPTPNSLSGSSLTPSAKVFGRNSSVSVVQGGWDTPMTRPSSRSVAIFPQKPQGSTSLSPSNSTLLSPTSYAPGRSTSPIPTLMPTGQSVNHGRVSPSLTSGRTSPSVDSVRSTSPSDMTPRAASPTFGSIATRISSFSVSISTPTNSNFQTRGRRSGSQEYGAPYALSPSNRVGEPETEEALFEGLDEQDRAELRSILDEEKVLIEQEKMLEEKLKRQLEEEARMSTENSPLNSDSSESTLSMLQ